MSFSVSESAHCKEVLLGPVLVLLSRGREVTHRKRKSSDASCCFSSDIAHALSSPVGRDSDWEVYSVTLLGKTAKEMKVIECTLLVRETNTFAVYLFFSYFILLLNFYNTSIFAYTILLYYYIQYNLHNIYF